MQRDAVWVAAFLSFSDPCRMVLSIPCGGGAIRVYERPRAGGSEPQVRFRAAFGGNKHFETRLWGAWSTSMRSAVASLLPKLKLKQEQRDDVWAEEIKVTEEEHTAMRHKSRIDGCPSAVVFFQKHPFEGIVRPIVRKADGKVRSVLSRKGHSRVHSNWHSRSEEAFECIQAKCISMGSEVPAMSHKRSVDAGVQPQPHSPTQPQPNCQPQTQPQPQTRPQPQLH